ncbi:MAG: lipid-A-disaccharide synthase [Candidatus Rokubacteria bacterium]|nr:lipid-A-disaccharide synthase [Candidatus Rokubacteria bacterium]
MTAADGRLIMLSAGEASGDLHGATMCRALRALDPGLRLIGMGGPRMAAAGVEILVDPTAHAAMGTSEALGRVPGLYRAYKLLVRRLREARPMAMVLIDFPEFNLRLAKQARRAGIPVVYFIPPQLWAWRRGRIRQMARRVTRVLAAFPFEKSLYEEAGVPVEFVGHPLLDVVPSDLDRATARERLGVGERQTLVGLLPGSRRQEVDRLLPPMLDAAARLSRADGRRCFVLGLAASVDRGLVTVHLRRASEAGGPPVEVVEGLTHEVMAASDALLIASGTATLEAALLGAPMVVCYRVSPLSEVVARLLNRSAWISLPNIVAGRGAVPEILQDDVTGARLASEAERLLVDSVAATAQRAAFKEVRSRLGQPGVGARAARAVLKVAGVA